MSTHDDTRPGSELTQAQTHGELEQSFANPGLPAHRHRMTDVDESAARRAERQVATLFGLSIIGTLMVLVSYYAVQLDSKLAYPDYARRLLTSNILIGVGLFIALFGIGAGAVHWAKTLMVDEERIDLRHPMRGSDAERAQAVAILKEGAGEAGLGRRPLIRNTLIGALAIFPIPAVVFLRDTGPLPGNKLSTTFWKAGIYLTKDPEGGRVRASDLSIGSVVHIMPEGIEETSDVLEEKAKAAVLLIRLQPELLAPASVPGSVDGIVAYSKICTHMGCPIALYEQTTHHLLCPCHQSTFDVTQDCKVVFGPAGHPLPQLAIKTDADGYLLAAAPFHEAVGPSFWERG